MAVQQIFEIPAMEEEPEGNYSFPEQYIGQLCKFGDKYVLFNEKNYEEFPIALIDVIIEAAKEDNNYITEEQMNKNINKIEQKSEKTINNTIKQIDDIREDMSVLNVELYDKVNVISEQISSMQSPEGIKKIISKELTQVHENYEKVMKQLIQEKAEELAKEIDEKSKKLDPMNMMLYKKLGMEMSEIIQMAKAGLI